MPWHIVLSSFAGISLISVGLPGASRTAQNLPEVMTSALSNGRKYVSIQPRVHAHHGLVHKVPGEIAHAVGELDVAAQVYGQAGAVGIRVVECVEVISCRACAAGACIVRVELDVEDLAVRGAGRGVERPAVD
ncbi:hypothetical protein H1235_07965 [Pseudoxanthomonas sp. NC8]|nr:hypothetical protein H1235_07965 [Pseudoxanthomonas sp. NC8]